MRFGEDISMHCKCFVFLVQRLSLDIYASIFLSSSSAIRYELLIAIKASLWSANPGNDLEGNPFN